MHYSYNINISGRFNLFSAPRLQRGAKEKDSWPLLPPVLQMKNNRGIYDERQQPALDQRSRSQSTMQEEWQSACMLAMKEPAKARGDAVWVKACIFHQSKY